MADIAIGEAPSLNVFPIVVRTVFFFQHNRNFCSLNLVLIGILKTAIFFFWKKNKNEKKPISPQNKKTKDFFKQSVPSTSFERDLYYHKVLFAYDVEDCITQGRQLEELQRTHHNSVW
jgi:hypothetical protein